MFGSTSFVGRFPAFVNFINMAEVKFYVHVEEYEGYYGVTLFADDGTEQDVVPCFRSVLQGEPGRDIDEVMVLFSEAHQDAMEDVGLSGIVPQSQYEDLLMQSVILAGEMMHKFGLEAVPFDQVPNAALYCLFAATLPCMENSPGSAALN
jgi:hypothetical protein